MSFRTAVRVIVIVCGIAAAARGEETFVYFFEDKTRNEFVNFEKRFDFNLTFYKGEPSHLWLLTLIDVHGCAQESFTYTTVRMSAEVSEKRAAEFMAAIRALPLDKLDSAKGDPNSWGSIEIDGKREFTNLRPEEGQRAAFEKLVAGLLKEVAPKAQKEEVRKTIVGDMTPAKRVSLEELLDDPKKYDGKRVVTTGYYHKEFEDSSLHISKEALKKRLEVVPPRSIWFSGGSSFAKPGDVKIETDADLLIEATFVAGPSGHMGGSPGELVRATKVHKVKK